MGVDRSSFGKMHAFSQNTNLELISDLGRLSARDMGQDHQLPIAEGTASDHLWALFYA